MSNRKQAENPIMRAKEVCEILGIGKNTLYQWCEQGKIPHKKVNRVLLFSHKRILEWLDNNENEGGNQ